MSYSSGRVTSDDSSSPSPNSLIHSVYKKKMFDQCYYQQRTYCCTQICVIVCLTLFTTIAALIFTGVALYLDNWAGIAINPYATLDLREPRLGPKYLDHVIFNDTIPNDEGTLYRYIDESRTPVNLVITRYGLLSHCKSPVHGPRLDLFETPWEAPVCRATYNQYQCPIVAIRTAAGSPPQTPMLGSRINGCIDKSKLCDGRIDCPSGHDEMNCNKVVECGENMVQCGNNKNVCIHKTKVCNGINDCGMYEDEQNCCGRAGFLRCADGSCVNGLRCDAKADCMDASDEYDCPSPSNSKYYTQCLDGQLIDASYKCEKKDFGKFECNDLSDETECDFEPKPLKQNPGLSSLVYTKGESCFKQAFTFQEVPTEVLENLYSDERQRQLMETYDFSKTKVAIIACIGVTIGLTVVSIILLALYGRCIQKCKTMRNIFILLATIFCVCIVMCIVIICYWVKYITALNDVMQNPASSNAYERVQIETIAITGGLAYTQISTKFFLYTIGLYSLGFIVCLVGVCLINRASCHHVKAQEYTGKYRSYLYNPENSSIDCHSKVGRRLLQDDVSTPDQIVSPQHSVRSLSGSGTGTPSDKIYSTYISYKEGDMDSLNKVDKMNTLNSHGTIRTILGHKQTDV